MSDRFWWVYMYFTDWTWFWNMNYDRETPNDCWVCRMCTAVLFCWMSWGTCNADDAKWGSTKQIHSSLEWWWHTVSRLGFTNFPLEFLKVYRSARAIIKLNGGGGTWPLVVLRLPRQPRHIRMLPVIIHISESCSVIEVYYIYSPESIWHLSTCISVV